LSVQVPTNLQGFKVATRLQGYKATRLQGYKAARLQGYKAARLQGYKATRVSPTPIYPDDDNYKKFLKKKI
jgi:hypothetical protein